MKIQAGKYTLHSDQYCFWISEQQPTGEKSKYETRDVRVAGYSTSIPNLIRSFWENQLRQSDATSMEELLNDIERITKDMLMLEETAIKEDLKLARKKRGIDD